MFLSHYARRNPAGFFLFCFFRQRTVYLGINEKGLSVSASSLTNSNHFMYLIQDVVFVIYVSRVGFIRHTDMFAWMRAWMRARSALLQLVFDVLSFETLSKTE